MKNFLLIINFLIAFSLPVFALNAGGVFGPVVNEDNHAVEWRSVIDTDSGNTVSRLHYQKAINGSLLPRAVVQLKNTGRADFDIDFFQAELFWQLTPDSSHYQSGFRADAVFRTNNRPSRYGLHWMNQFRLSSTQRLRAVLLTFIDSNNSNLDDIVLHFRTQYHQVINKTFSLGIETYSDFGVMSNNLSWDDQSHQWGPYTVITFQGGYQLYLNYLDGLTNGSVDGTARLFLTKHL